MGFQGAMISSQPEWVFLGGEDVNWIPIPKKFCPSRPIPLQGVEKPGMNREMGGNLSRSQEHLTEET